MIEIPIEILIVLYDHCYNPATDWRDPPEVSTAWREVANIAGLKEQCTCGEDNGKDPNLSLPHKAWRTKEE